MDATAELDAATRWLRWSENPCGKPKLELPKLAKLPYSTDEPSLGVSFAVGQERAPMLRSTALAQLEAAYHYKRDFPGEIRGAYQGVHPDDASVWTIIIYGEGDPWPVLPEPPKPEFMR